VTLKAIHVGPHKNSLGGTQSVIRTIEDFSIGADQLRVVPTWNGRNQLRNAFLVARAAAAILGASRDTVLHFHVSNGGAWIREGLLIVLARAVRKKVVVTLHGGEFPEFAGRHPRFVRAILARADQIICLWDQARAVIAKILMSDNVTILANPVAISYDAPPADEAAPIALFVGRVSRPKGVDVLVEAWRTLLAEGVEGHCRIVGPIHDFTPPSLERLSVEDAVHPDDVRSLLCASRLVVLPSRAEGMSMILTEALATARPFVATPVGGTPQITPDENMLVPVDDADALARAMQRYLTDGRLAAAAGRRGQQYIIETRSPEVIDVRLREIYARI
jgi:glycosyltransferase involved in cell wall biosynthesis